MVVESLGGLRETPKFLLIKAIDCLRSRLLEDAHALHAQGESLASRTFFDLTLEDLAAAAGDPTLDLRRRRAERRRPVDRLAGVNISAALFDSRGRIFGRRQDP